MTWAAADVPASMSDKSGRLGRPLLTVAESSGPPRRVAEP